MENHTQPTKNPDSPIPPQQPSQTGQIQTHRLTPRFVELSLPSFAKYIEEGGIREQAVRPKQAARPCGSQNPSSLRPKTKHKLPPSVLIRRAET